MNTAEQRINHLEDRSIESFHLNQKEKKKNMTYRAKNPKLQDNIKLAKTELKGHRKRREEKQDVINLGLLSRHINSV